MKIRFGYYKHSLINQAEVDKNINHKQSQNSHEHVKQLPFEYMNMLFTNYWATVKIKEFSYMVCKYKLTYISYEFEEYREYGLIFYKNTLFCALEYDALLVDVL